MPKCIFQVGDRVADLDGERPGTVTQIGEWSDFQQCFPVKVAQFDGPHHWRISNQLKSVQ